MQLLDDHLFRLWREGKVTAEDAMAKAKLPDDLKKRIADAKRGMFEDEEDIERQAAMQLKEGAGH